MLRQNKNLFILLLFFLISSILIFVVFKFRHKYYGFYTKKEINNFKLESIDSKSFELNSLKGKNIFLYFGFTKCKVSCPSSFGLLKQISDKLNDKDVKFIFVSIDFKRDSIEELEKFKTNFDSRFIFLKDTDEKVRSIAKEFSVSYSDEVFSENQNAQIHHTGHIFFIHKNFDSMLIYPSSFLDSDKILEDYKKFSN